MTTGRVLFFSLSSAIAIAAVLVWRDGDVAEREVRAPHASAHPLELVENNMGSPEVPSPVMPTDSANDANPRSPSTETHKAVPPSSLRAGLLDVEPDLVSPPVGLPEWAPAEVGERRRVPDADGGDLRGRNWAGADLAHVDFRNADLRGADLTDANLLGASLRDADLEGAKLATALLMNADMRGANLPEVQLGPMNLSHADLREANLRGVSFASPDPPRRSAVMYANFEGADLRDSDFGRTVIEDSIFTNADLRGANLAGARWRPRSLLGAKYDERTRLPPGIDPVEWGMVKVP